MRTKVINLARDHAPSLPEMPWGLVGGLPRPQRSYKDWLNVSDTRRGDRIDLTRTVAKRKTLFDDRPVEISELTYVIKQDLASLNHQIAGLQALTLSQHPKASRSRTDQEGEHNDNVGRYAGRGG